MADRVGQQLGNYRLIRLLGQGGFSDVYLGKHIHLDTHAAIKVLRTQLTSDDVKKFRIEARTIAHLEHPNIVRVLEFGVEGTTPFLVMSYAPNGTLRKRHPRGSQLPLPIVMTYIRQLADALQYAHQQKLIHRDVKPENMLLGRNHEVLLSDFGFVLIAQSSTSQNTQEMAGTIPYMSPEQLQGHPRPASDQYALGIVIYEWLTGDRPFQGSALEVATQHMLTPPPSMRKQNPTIPADVEEVVLIALAKDPQQRFVSIKAFATALEQASPSERVLLSDSTIPLEFSAGTSESLSAFPSIELADHSATTIATPSVEQSLSDPHSSGSVPVSGVHSDSAIYQQRRISRRAVIVGLAGLAAVGAGIGSFIWFSHSQNNPAAGKWTPAGRILLGRQYFRATTLKSGLVLIEGGAIPASITNESELFDPKTGVWTQTGSLSETRAAHSATLLRDGKVLVAAGVGAYIRFLNSAELYDPTTGSWTPTGEGRNYFICRSPVLMDFALARARTLIMI